MLAGCFAGRRATAGRCCFRRLVRGMLVLVASLVVQLLPAELRAGDEDGSRRVGLQVVEEVLEGHGGTCGKTWATPGWCAVWPGDAAVVAGEVRGVACLVGAMLMEACASCGAGGAENAQSGCRMARHCAGVPTMHSTLPPGNVKAMGSRSSRSRRQITMFKNLSPWPAKAKGAALARRLAPASVSGQATYSPVE